MMGSFLTRGIIMLLGYVYPAYECFKIVERKKPDLEHLRFWCQYWIIIAVLTVSERVGDVLISWVPMYSEAKLAFIIYLWYPRSKVCLYFPPSPFSLYWTQGCGCCTKPCGHYLLFLRAEHGSSVGPVMLIAGNNMCLYNLLATLCVKA
jgi:hypothetical protein